jgi:hypothetical protein
VNLDHCLRLVKQWHSLRTDFEQQLYALLTKDEGILESSQGSYRKEIFHGHCDEDGNSGYKLIGGKGATFGRIPELYEANHMP